MLIAAATPEEIPGNYNVSERGPRMNQDDSITQWVVASKAAAHSLAYLRQLEGEAIHANFLDGKPLNEQFLYLVGRMERAEEERELMLCQTIPNLKYIASGKLPVLPPFRALGIHTAKHINGLDPDVAGIYQATVYIVWVAIQTTGSSDMGPAQACCMTTTSSTFKDVHGSANLFPRERRLFQALSTNFRGG